MLAGIRDILIISTPKDLPRFEEMFGSGSRLGLSISYEEQPKPNGIAEAFIIGKKFIGTDSTCLILGDNIFFGHSLTDILRKTRQDVETKGGATVFGYYVNDPERYGVVEFDGDGNALSVVEKPKEPKSNYAVTGLYFYDNKVAEIVKQIKPSWRGELEITDVNNAYLKKGSLRVELLGRGYAWLDTGTFEALFDAGEFIQAIEKRQGLKIACIEEIAYKMGYIDKRQLKKVSASLQNSAYGKYLQGLLK